MACLSKIQSAITYDCDSGNVGLLSALLINKEDIASFAFSAGSTSFIDSLTLKEGAKAYKIDTVKKSLVITESLKVNEGAPNAFTHSVTTTVTATQNSSLYRDLINPSANGSFVVLTLGLTSPGQTGNPVRVYGLYYGMSATAIDRSSHENGGWFTITMSTPERVIGEDTLSLMSSMYNTLYNAAVG